MHFIISPYMYICYSFEQKIQCIANLFLLGAGRFFPRRPGGLKWEFLRVVTWTPKGRRTAVSNLSCRHLSSLHSNPYGVFMMCFSSVFVWCLFVCLFVCLFFSMLRVVFVDIEVFVIFSVDMRQWPYRRPLTWAIPSISTCRFEQSEVVRSLYKVGPSHPLHPSWNVHLGAVPGARAFYPPNSWIQHWEVHFIALKPWKWKQLPMIQNLATANPW